MKFVDGQHLNKEEKPAKKLDGIDDEIATRKRRKLSAGEAMGDYAKRLRRQV